MKNIRTILKVILGLMGLTLVYSGFIWAFTPEVNFSLYDIQVGTVAGMNMIKSDIGGPLMMVGIMLIVYALREGFWFYPTLLLTLSYLIIRIISVIVDGPAQIAIIGIIMEIIVAIIIVALRRVSMSLD